MSPRQRWTWVALLAAWPLAAPPAQPAPIGDGIETFLGSEGRSIELGGNPAVTGSSAPPAAGWTAASAAPRPPSQILEEAPAEDWRRPRPEDLLVLKLETGDVVIELAPDFAPGHAERMRELARSGFYRGLTFYRVVDGFVAQAGRGEGEVLEEEGAAAGPGPPPLAAEIERPGEALAFTPLGYPDPFAPEAGYVLGFPAARDPATGRMWLAHCPGAVAMARDEALDTGASELYVVIGHGPRYLDRNLTIFGRVLAGMEHLQALRRGGPGIGIVEDPAERGRILDLVVAADLPVAERPRLEVLRTDSDSFRELIVSRANRPESFFVYRPGAVDLCGVPIPVRPAPVADPPAAEAPAGEASRNGARRRPAELDAKPSSGRSQAGRVRLDAAPAPSPLGTGFDSERVWGVGDDWEPAVAADPSAPVVYQLTTRYGGPRAEIYFRRSTDGGATWQPDRPLVATGREQNDPQLAVANDGTVFALWLDRWETRLVRSFDQGDTWTAPVEVAPGLPFTDHGWLAIAADGRDVYVALNASDSYVVASHDGGASFGPPVRTSDDSRYWFHTGGAVAADGTVYFAAADYDAVDFSGDVGIDVLRSVDGGGSWTTTRVDTSRETPPCDWSPGCYFGFLGPVTALAVDSTGQLLLAYNAGRTAGAPQQIRLRASLDGVRWSRPRALSHPDFAAHNAFPALAAGPGPGDFRLVWQGTGDADTDTWNTWYRRTTDGGRTWSAAVRLSDLPDGAPYKSEGGYRFPYGDYLGLAVDAAGTAHVVWGEGTNFVGPGGTWSTRGE